MEDLREGGDSRRGNETRATAVVEEEAIATKKASVESAPQESMDVDDFESKTKKNPEMMVSSVCSSGQIHENDRVILYANPHDVQALYAKRGCITNNRYGSFHHDDLIGKSFGARAFARDTGRWLYVLKPTPELWTRTLPHRTQIIYSLDSSVICFKLGLRRGHVVVESGTGSGSLSHHFMRCVGRGGHLHTFEFNEHRANTARQEFKRHGVSECVTVKCTDVCANGFGEDLNGKVDSVFLDLPAPWKAISHASLALRPNGSICSFSPCIEQVQQTCLELSRLGFNRIETIESLLKTFDMKQTGTRRGKSIPVRLGRDRRPASTDANTSTSKSCEGRRYFTRPQSVMRGHTSYLTFARKGPRASE